MAPSPSYCWSPASSHRIEAEPTSNLFVDFVEAINEDRPSRIPAEDRFCITAAVLKAGQAADEKRWIEL